MDHTMSDIKPKISKTLCVGLTGGIGTGKSTVADIFKTLGAPIIDADDISHKITQKNGIAYTPIISHFGKNILNTDGTINRKKLRDIIFQNPGEKKWLENLLHPIIRQTMHDRIQKIKAPYCICVIPLLAESSGIAFIDRILVVDTPIDTQIERAKKRDSATEDQIKKIIASQASQSSRIKIADDVIINDGDLKTLENKVRELHEKYSNTHTTQL